MRFFYLQSEYPHPEEHRHLSFETAALRPPQDEVAMRLEG